MGLINKNKIKNLKQRNRKEIRFALFGKICVFAALAFLLLLFSSLIYKGAPAFFRTQLAIEIDLTKFNKIEEIDLRKTIKSSLRQQFIDSDSNPEISQLNSLYQLLSKASNLELKKQLASDSNLFGRKSVFWLSSSSKVDIYFKHGETSSLNDYQLNWLQIISKNKQYRKVFNFAFFKFGDSREAEIAGIAAGTVGSVFLVLVFLSLAFPLAVMCAFYLEEFAPKNHLTNLLEASINNLAAIPSVIYGLLGLVLYLQFFNIPRSSSLVGGLTLSLLALPVIIITTRNTIRTIPRSIREGAVALGATKIQVVLHHLLPLSLPGIMTGTILAISRAIGETAPLLMIGMIAFVADVPSNFFEPSSALPVQVFLWSDLPETGFSEKTCAAILVLLLLLVALNLSATLIRKKFEKKW